MRRPSIALLVLALAPAPVLALDIPGDPSSCGIVVERGDPGVLQGDLDCTGQPSFFAIELRPGAKLELNGHTISGARGANVSCFVAATKACTIAGPGEITGAPFGVSSASRLKMSDVDVHQNDVGIHIIYGAVSHAALVKLDRVTVRDNDAEGIKGGGILRITDSSITGNGDVGTTSYGPSRLKRTTITGNGSFGIVTGVYSPSDDRYIFNKNALALADSTVTGNGVLDGGVDILAGRRPNVVRTMCGTSANALAPGNPTFGVCAGD